MVVELKTEDAKLVLSGTDEWCEVYLLNKGKRFDLGADSYAVVVTRLSVALDDEMTMQPAGEIDGLSVGWVASLAEQHATIYASLSSSPRIMFFQDEQGKTFARLKLDENERRCWISELARFTTEYL